MGEIYDPPQTYVILAAILWHHPDEQKWPSSTSTTVRVNDGFELLQIMSHGFENSHRDLRH